MTWMSGICLFLISMRTHSKMRNFEKSDLIYVNSPLRHLEFNSTFRYFSSKMKNDFTYDFTLACRGFFFFFLCGWHISSPVEHTVYIPPLTTRETEGALIAALDLRPTILLPQPLNQVIEIDLSWFLTLLIWEGNVNIQFLFTFFLL